MRIALPLPLRRPVRPATRGRRREGAPPAAAATADYLAPDAIDGRHPHHVALDGTLHRTVAVTGHPRELAWGWLGRVATCGVPLNLAVHIEPLDGAQVQRQFRDQLTLLKTSHAHAQDTGRLQRDDRTQAIADREELNRAIERKEEAVYRCGIYAGVRAPDLTTLEGRTRDVEAAFGAARLQTRRVPFEAEAGLESTLPAGRDGLGRAATLRGQAVAATYPFGAPGLRMDRGIWYGRDTVNNTFVVVDPFAPGFTNYNACIVAGSGGGKSTALKVEIARGIGAGIDVFALDPAGSGEYRALAGALGGQVVRLSPGSRDHINPLDLPLGLADDAEGDPHDLLAEHVESVKGLLDILLAGTDGRLDTRALARLERALFAAYATAGITAEPGTHRRPVPTLRDLHAALAGGAGGEDTDGLAERLYSYAAGSRSGLFAGRTTVRPARLTLFELHGVEGDDLRAAMMYLVSQHVWGVVRGERKRRAFYLDEYHLLSRKAHAAPFLAGLTKLARKHWLSAVGASQDPEDLVATEAGRALVLNSARTLLLRNEPLAMPSLATAVTLSGAQREYLTGCAPGQGLLLVQDPQAPGQRRAIEIEIMVSPELAPLVFTDPDPDASSRPGAHAPLPVSAPVAVSRS